MPLLGFQRRFAAPVCYGQKLTSIRARRRDGRDPKPGDRLYLWTGLRTKVTRKLGEAIARKVTPIQLVWTEVGVDFVVLEGIVLAPGSAEAIARADGFADLSEMTMWFRKRFEWGALDGAIGVPGRQMHGWRFAGLLIEWFPPPPPAELAEPPTWHLDPLE